METTSDETWQEYADTYNYIIYLAFDTKEFERLCGEDVKIYYEIVQELEKQTGDLYKSKINDGERVSSILLSIIENSEVSEELKTNIIYNIDVIFRIDQLYEVIL